MEIINMPQIRHVKIYPTPDNCQLANTDVVKVSQAIAYLAQITKNIPTAELRGWAGVTVQADVEVSDLQVMQERIDSLKALLLVGSRDGFTADQVKDIINKL